MTDKKQHPSKYVRPPQIARDMCDLFRCEILYGRLCKCGQGTNTVDFANAEVRNHWCASIKKDVLWLNVFVHE
jgi:hypothetical protein